jgi:hypothetical protein
VKPCPETCLCHGLAFVCDQPFHADLYPQLRYLDGTGSGITPNTLTSNVYLIHLTLSAGYRRCPQCLTPTLSSWTCLTTSC